MRNLRGLGAPTIMVEWLRVLAELLSERWCGEEQYLPVLSHSSSMSNLSDPLIHSHTSQPGELDQVLIDFSNRPTASQHHGSTKFIF